MKLIILFAFVSYCYSATVRTKRHSSDESNESAELHWHEYKSQIPTENGFKQMDVMLVHFGDEQIIGISVKRPEAKNGSSVLLDFNSGYAATVNDNGNMCIVNQLPVILDYESQKEYFQEVLNEEDNVLPSLYCEYQVPNSDTSVYGDWIDNFCSTANSSILELVECFHLDHESPSSVIMALQKNCLIIAYAVDNAEDGQLACIRGGYSSEERFSAGFRLQSNHVTEPNGYVQGLIHPYQSTQYISGDIILAGDDTTQPYQGAMFVDFSNGVSGMINYGDDDDTDYCALVTFEAGKTLIDFFSEFENPESGIAFYKCSSRNEVDLGSYGSEVLTKLCDDKPRYLLENCVQDNEVRSGNQRCMFLGLIYGVDGKVELACVRDL